MSKGQTSQRSRTREVGAGARPRVTAGNGGDSHLNQLAASLLSLTFGLIALGCTETRDLGSTSPHGQLPVDERNPVVLLNDNVFDNWQGVYALLLANSGGPTLAGIVVNTSPPWSSIKDNLAGWSGLVTAARNSGMRDVPEPLTSTGERLVRPASGEFADTAPNGSGGAWFIVNESKRLSLPYRPLVVVTGGRLTDVADAFLLDPTVTERVVVVSSLGSATDTGGSMAAPNGEMDPWADWIVASRFRFVQVSAFYDQLGDVPKSRISELPDNPLGAWIAEKQSKIWSNANAADQVAVMAVAIPSFTVAVQRVSPTSAGPSANAGPDLVAGSAGNAWLVTQSASAGATERFWNALRDPATFNH